MKNTVLIDVRSNLENIEMQLKGIDLSCWHRVNNDVNGNPRYAIHFLDFAALVGCGDIEAPLLERYAALCKLANKLGGRKYHTKKFGGGIVFQSYNLRDTHEFIANSSNK